MVRLENGRVVADDLSTIETVISSIDMVEVPFTVIINNVKKRQFREIMKKEEAFKGVVTTINAGQYTRRHGSSSSQLFQSWMKWTTLLLSFRGMQRLTFDTKPRRS
ncbi:hypothetical protein PHYPSEUDO_005322 [Phytophthora pseudosyringae]|uniref:Uncharacterized protein n=1 Tax=Phytophthora pseudosyringae TaxID=221518 RepID=A0A8T1V1B4_9STRA|nr:hypothetical protein PHYPSEUDO_005322 [Phytophthora pseudosyringae]